MNSTHKDWSDRICTLFAEIRRARQITQSELAKRLNISQPHLSKIESKRAIPTIVQWMHFCQLFDVPSDVVAREKSFKEFLIQVRLGDLASDVRKRRASA